MNQLFAAVTNRSHDLLMQLATVVFSLSCLTSEAATDLQLPSLGDSTSSIISLEQERELGQEWLRSYNNQVRFNRDYLLQDYVEGLVYKLAPYSGVNASNLSVLLIQNPSMNAFAVPGGIIGVNTGLFFYARSEGELVSVLAHELAHLSRRHFARRVAEQKTNAVTSMAGILAGIVLAATVGGDAGLAMISASQAASLSSQLSYSRQNEQEADRLGMEIMANAGYDPQDVTKMFERMLEATRYVGYQVPEYLRSHPLAESRISDTQARANQYPNRLIPQSNDYYDLMRARALVSQSDTPFHAIQRFQAELNGNFLPRFASQYGLALAFLQNGQHSSAEETLTLLLQESPNNPAYQLLLAELQTASGSYDQAILTLKQGMRFASNQHAFIMQLSKSLNLANRHEDAIVILEAHIKKRPTDPAIWYELAETYGLAGNILGVHKARAEYFKWTGGFNQAIQQLKYAKDISANDPIESAVLDQKISEIASLREKGALLK